MNLIADLFVAGSCFASWLAPKTWPMREYMAVVAVVYIAFKVVTAAKVKKDSVQ